MTVEERRRDRRSKVRVQVTYWAALYVFGGAAALIALVLWGEIDEGSFDSVREIYTLGLPIATGVITYWFASRQQGQQGDPEIPIQSTGTVQTTGGAPRTEPT